VTIVEECRRLSEAGHPVAHLMRGYVELHFTIIKHVFMCVKHKVNVLTCQKAVINLWANFIQFQLVVSAMAMFSGSVVTTGLHVLRLQMEEETSRYAG
jgi:uncharacterized membrane protein